MRARVVFQYRNHHHPIPHTMMASLMKHADRIRSVLRVHNRWVDKNLGQANLVSIERKNIDGSTFINGLLLRKHSVLRQLERCISMDDL